MKFIESLGETLVYRLKNLCLDCETPGWGKIDIQAGLPCSLCSLPTDEIKSEIYGCTKCKHIQALPPKNGKEKADPTYCGFCNP